MPKPKFVKLNVSEILNIYLDEYVKNYDHIKFINFINNDIYINFDQSHLDIILNNLFKNSIEAGKNFKNFVINISLDNKDNLT